MCSPQQKAWACFFSWYQCHHWKTFYTVWFEPWWEYCIVVFSCFLVLSIFARTLCCPNSGRLAVRHQSYMKQKLQSHRNQLSFETPDSRTVQRGHQCTSLGQEQTCFQGNKHFLEIFSSTYFQQEICFRQFTCFFSQLFQMQWILSKLYFFNNPPPQFQEEWNCWMGFCGTIPYWSLPVISSPKQTVKLLTPQWFHGRGELQKPH